MNRSSTVCLTVVLSLALAIQACALATAQEVAKNNGISIEGAVQKAAPPDLPNRTKVRASVSYPSGSDCVLAGDTGTVYCYDPGDPYLPYLINWDKACGREQCHVCDNCAPNGWWVGFDDIEVVNSGPCSAPTASTVTLYDQAETMPHAYGVLFLLVTPLAALMVYRIRRCQGSRPRHSR